MCQKEKYKVFQFYLFGELKLVSPLPGEIKLKACLVLEEVWKGLKISNEHSYLLFLRLSLWEIFLLSRNTSLELKEVFLQSQMPYPLMWSRA